LTSAYYGGGANYRSAETTKEHAMIRFSSTKAVPSIIAIGATLLTTSVLAFAAENVSPDTIVRALQPKPLTRGLSVETPADSAKTAAEGRFVETLRNRKTRSLSSGEREEIATIAADKPNIDLEITFDYNSADISAKSMPGVQALGKALSDPTLKGSTFLVAGNTDAVGGESYNQDLSERRADSIKRYLVDKFGIAGTDLVTVGYGKSKPKDPSAPMDPSNRRVQVVNMANKTASK
jgi:outer membrane protein OmpA-like peptidoglycan-associated protein